MPDGCGMSEMNHLKPTFRAFNEHFTVFKKVRSKSIE